MEKILIVEDEERTLALYERRLKKKGYQVVPLADGRETLEKVKEEEPDLVVLDVKMGDVDGLQLLREIKGHRKSLPVILNSAYSIYKWDFKSWIADAYIVKSSNLDELESKIEEILLPISSGRKT
jgi:DNA-binding response OmpR family regulator